MEQHIGKKPNFSLPSSVLIWDIATDLVEILVSAAAPQRPGILCASLDSMKSTNN